VVARRLVSGRLKRGQPQSAVMPGTLVDSKLHYLNARHRDQMPAAMARNNRVLSHLEEKLA
jgi:hypothetical protein